MKPLLLAFFYLWLVLNPLTVWCYTELSNNALESIPDSKKGFDVHDGRLLAPILIPRVSGTEGSTKVLNHFVEYFRNELPSWNLAFQNSTSTTPATQDRQIPFVNLIATRDPPWLKDTPGDVSYLTLVAHYDSKYTPNGFIGATDSAAPCAMLMQIAKNLDGVMAKKWEDMRGKGGDPLDDSVGDLGLQIIFLDGEEAFQSWTHTDSLYGARSLAEEWEGTFHPALSTYQTPLSSISLFLLLDLLGAADPMIPSYFQTTHWAYQKMAYLERRLRDLGKFKSAKAAEKRKSVVPHPGHWLVHFQEEPQRWLGGLIEDDHLPFMARGVEVLHMIPNPFPSVWHTMDDNGDALDEDTVEDWTTLVTAFAAEWLDIGDLMTKINDEPSVKGKKEARSEL